MSKRIMYEATDRYIKRLKELIRKEFNHLSVMSFDELNVVRVKQETSDMFERLLEFNRKEYLAIAKAAREYALEQLSAAERKKALAEKREVDFFVEVVLTGYNDVTGYLYGPEADRKRLRLAEEIMTAKEFRDRGRLDKSLRRGANLWFTQSQQYAIAVEDETTGITWEDAGIKRFKWIAEKDSRTCAECRALDGKIFPAKSFPSKFHYNCRCYRVPV